jgi:CRISPR/Cas system type I-B associated protein Csh2 (Cas7 group RAMP superfamily)
MKQKLLDMYEETLRRTVERKQEAIKELNQRLPNKPPIYKSQKNQKIQIQLSDFAFDSFGRPLLKR